MDEADARIDPLTGLLSREAFFQEAHAYLLAHEGEQACIVCFDMDRFKLFNDLHGFERGDGLLVSLARALESRFSFDGRFPLGRLAADLFCLCIDDARPEVVARVLANLLPHSIGAETVVRAGIYRVEDPSCPVGLMCDRATMALRSTKGSYSDRVAVYDFSMRDALLEERSVALGIEKALREGSIEVHMQPKCNMRTGRIVGAEALVRWRHPQRGIIPPSEFIPLLERNGLICSLDLHVWELTVAWIRDLLDAGVRPVPVSVNVSRPSIYLMDVAEELAALASRYGVPASLIEAEVTEGAYSEQPDRVIAAFDALAARGFTVLMDDFGGGYSSLNMLKNANVDVLKMDMRFLDGDDLRSRGIMESMVRMARWLGLPVIAEGVETRDQVDFLLSVGCGYAQGYHFARPMESRAFASIVAEGSSIEYEEQPFEESYRAVLDFRDLLRDNMISDRLLARVIGAVALFSLEDDDVRMTAGNVACQRLLSSLGCAGEDALNMGGVLDRLSEHDRAVLLEAARRAVECCPEWGAEAVVAVKGSSGRRWLKIRLFPLRRAGVAEVLYGSISEVTSYMEVVEALRTSERRFETAMAAIGLVAFELDIAARTVRYSEFVRERFGLHAAEMRAPEGFIEKGLVAEESIQAFRDMYESVYLGADRASAVIHGLLVDGSSLWSRITITVVEGSGEPSRKAIGLVEDIAQAKELGRRLRQPGAGGSADSLHLA